MPSNESMNIAPQRMKFVFWVMHVDELLKTNGVVKLSELSDRAPASTTAINGLIWVTARLQKKLLVSDVV